jgi:uncharacterized protein
MLIPTLIMAAIALTLIIVGYYQGKGQHVHGIRLAVNTTLQILPLLICSFLVAGMVQVLLPQELVSAWVGEAAGLRGLLIGTAAGVLTPGGPYVSLPLAAGFLQAGAGIGTMVAFLTGWGLGSLSRMPMQVGILGWKFTLIYLASVLSTRFP